MPKTDPQAYGSALTYARRYGLSAMVDLLAEDDDDANMACKGGTTRLAELRVLTLGRLGISAIKPRQNAVMENLPHIDGIIYQQQKAQDGALYITVTGNTRNRNGILQEAGFK